MLQDVFLRLYEHIEFEKEIRDRIKSALRYPMFVVAAMVIALIDHQHHRDPRLRQAVPRASTRSCR